MVLHGGGRPLPNKLIGSTNPMLNRPTLNVALYALLMVGKYPQFLPGRALSISSLIKLQKSGL